MFTSTHNYCFGLVLFPLFPSHPTGRLERGAMGGSLAAVWDQSTKPQKQAVLAVGWVSQQQSASCRGSKSQLCLSSPRGNKAGGRKYAPQSIELLTHGTQEDIWGRTESSKSSPLSNSPSDYHVSVGLVWYVTCHILWKARLWASYLKLCWHLVLNKKWVFQCN